MVAMGAKMSDPVAFIHVDTMKASEKSRMQTLQQGERFLIPEQNLQHNAGGQVSYFSAYVTLGQDSGQVRWREMPSDANRKGRTGTISLLLVDSISPETSTSLVLWRMGGAQKFIVLEAGSANLRDLWLKGLREALMRYKGAQLVPVNTPTPVTAPPTRTPSRRMSSRLFRQTLRPDIAGKNAERQLWQRLRNTVWNKAELGDDDSLSAGADSSSASTATTQQRRQEAAAAAAAEAELVAAFRPRAAAAAGGAPAADRPPRQHRHRAAAN